jgi:hypothetical protein
MMGLVGAVALAGCGGGGAAEQPGAAASSSSVDSGPQPTPALDSVGTTTTTDPGRSD